VQTHHAKIAILGSGPAGYTAALYAARANLEPLVVSGHQPGGQLTITTEVENYPGFPKGVLGPELMELFKEQAERFGTRYVHGTVTRVELGKRPFRLVVDEHDEVICEALIVATGATAKLLGLPSEQELMGYGVSACATCDGFFFKNKEVAVVGGGDTAMEEATYLSGLCKSVTLVHRRDEFRASRTMVKRVVDNPKIKILYNSVIDEVKDPAEDRVTGVVVKDVKTGDKHTVPCAAMFVAIGHTPMTELFVGQLDLHPNGYLKTTPGSTRTSVPGVFASGDVQDFTYRQAVTAAGTGCMAALDAERWLGANEGH